ncbi:8-amino-7-oxononanoate synthase [Bradyrhizobium sp. SSBR45G]|uniref:8-amino-7-oxononanoate synthase n=1 Tax=unclassified Bradyrhizobium TaxID=2631580 RepID=UPI002342A1C4|nr:MULTISPECIES: 8-amino-7-oxononanoate synthase [unclassified Bradyrhizobium]GLH81025.1 8-amino-7-oxononanoate synthase [Bradyrhizobium sp. SSBR45G]GLH89242.1 8-amino-7-oxononanoate synthase [Bradyrhizobium sp. SSBR45R]
MQASANRLAGYAKGLEDLAADDRLRRLSPRSGLDFSSNDYLGLAQAPRMKRAVAAAIEAGTPVGAGGSRLLRGNCAEHERLEAEAARFFGADSALFFGSGYMANFAVLTTLPQADDLLVLDALVHASTHEGARAGRAETCQFVHNDPQSADERILAWRRDGGIGRPWIVVESLYSMDGDIAPLDDLIAVAERHDAFLLIDEAHATGVRGAQGRGLASAYDGRDNIVIVHTCGKALGAAGALVTASRVLRDTLINRCRPFIFATAPSPLMAVAVSEALATLQDEPERQQRLTQLVAFAHREIVARFGETWSSSQIIPYVVGDNARAMNLAGDLQLRGFDIRGIRPPTVPAGTARLRLSLTLNVDEAAVTALLDALVELEGRPRWRSAS